MFWQVRSGVPARIPGPVFSLIACPTFGDARLINEINTLLEQEQVPRNNYTALKALFSSSEEISELLTRHKKWYAIWCGKETGIWVDYHWYAFLVFYELYYRCINVNQG